MIELETLYLDRTSLTDIGLGKLQGKKAIETNIVKSGPLKCLQIGLSKLETLSLSHTKITNDGLCMLGDFERTSFTRNLRTLNLAQCTLVTDRGVRGLAGKE